MNARPPRPPRAALALSVVASLAGALLASAAPAWADGVAASVNAELGSAEIRGFAGTTSNAVTLRQKRNGTVIAAKTFTTDGSGFYEVSLKPIKGGDKLIIVFAGSRTVTVPRLALSLDAAADTISGRIPTPSSVADLTVSDVVGSYTKGSANPTFPTDTGGRFSGGFPGLAGGDEAELRWSNSNGDAFTIRRAATAAEVQVGSPKAWLWGAPRATVTARLLARDGDVRGTATVTIPGGQSSAQATFRRNGSAVKVRPGDRVRIGTQTGLKVRTPDLEAATLSIVATCFHDQDWLAGTVFGGGAFSYLVDGTTDGTGLVNGSWVGPLSSGTKVKLLCENANGWAQDMVTTVP